jgi:hypothetical protein
MLQVRAYIAEYYPNVSGVEEFTKGFLQHKVRALVAGSTFRQTALNLNRAVARRRSLIRTRPWCRTSPP